LTKAATATVTVNTGGSSNPFTVGQSIAFTAVPAGSMVEINNLTGLVLSTGGSSGAWTATVNINSSRFSTYTSGGQAAGLPFNSGGLITAITQASQAVVTVNSSNLVNPFMIGETVYFSGVPGMVQINGLSGNIVATGGGVNGWTITVHLDSSGFSPYSGGPAGLAIASDAYLGLGQYYGGPALANGTYNLLIENVTIAQFVVGIGQGLSGASALTANITCQNVNVSVCDVLYAIGHAQAKDNSIVFGNLTSARTGIDAINYGAQAGWPPYCQRQNFGFLYRLFALFSVGEFVLEDPYAESIACLGQFGFGGGAAFPMVVNGGHFKLDSSGWNIPHSGLQLRDAGPPDSIRSLPLQ
jgi:hypothetical protein